MTDTKTITNSAITGISYSYDVQSCGRCGGNGRYSWCASYGSTCFRCGGSGNALTAAAKRAKKTIAKHRATEVPDIPAAEVRVGMVAWLARGMTSNSWQTVTAVDPDPLNPGRYTLTGKNMRQGMLPNGTVRVMPTAAQFKTFAAKLTRLRTGVTITATLADGTKHQLNNRGARAAADEAYEKATR